MAANVSLLLELLLLVVVLLRSELFPRILDFGTGWRPLRSKRSSGRKRRDLTSWLGRMFGTRQLPIPHSEICLFERGSLPMLRWRTKPP